MTTTDDILKLFLKFNPQMDFSDSPTGFFGGLRETFDQLAREENMTCQLENLDPVDYPSFGSRDDDYNDVVRPFYAAWNGFATKKSFAWKDVHRYSEAPDRRIRRLMEKENKRLREEGVREFNDAVRSLVAFARKRDPRCKGNAQNEAERQKSLREAAAAQAARSRAANEAKLQPHIIPDWAQTGDQEDISSESEAESEKVHFECVVCRKIFKSEKQFEAHERSKKHLKAVKQLRWEMRLQDEVLDLDESRSNGVSPSFDGAGKTHQSANTSEDGLERPQQASLSGDVELAHAERHGGDDARDAGFHVTPGGHNEAESVEGGADGSTSQEPVGTEASGSEDEVNNPTDTTGSVDGITAKLSATSVDDDNSPPVRVGKAKQKRARKAAAQNSPSEIKCMACGSTFPSNTQLFAHVRELNHAQPVLKPGKASGKKKR